MTRWWVLALVWVATLWAAYWAGEVQGILAYQSLLREHNRVVRAYAALLTERFVYGLSCSYNATTT